jgi:carbonic anhydrase
MNKILNGIIKNNANFVSEHGEDFFKQHMAGQHPRITLVSCCDSRCHAHAIEPDPIDKIFTVETIGNQMTSAQGSVDYGVLHLHTPVLLIMGHTDCGAIKAFMKGYEKENEDIRRELNNLKGGLKPVLNPKSVFDSELLRNIQKNVDYQVSVALERYKKLIAENALTVVGAIYDFLNAMGKGYGRVVITSINAEKEASGIKALAKGAELESCLGRVC